MTAEQPGTPEGAEGYRLPPPPGIPDNFREQMLKQGLDTKPLPLLHQYNWLATLGFSLKNNLIKASRIMVPNLQIDMQTRETGWTLTVDLPRPADREDVRLDGDQGPTG